MLQNANEVSPYRRLAAFATVGLLFSILFLRYYWIMIVSHSRYAEKAAANYIRAVPVPAARGIISDRKGRILVDNVPAYTVSVIPIEVKKHPGTLTKLAEMTNTTLGEVKRLLERHRRGLFTPAKIFSRVPFDVFSRLQEHRLELPGVTYSIEPVRAYPSGLKLSHLLGYTRQISREDLNHYEGDYQPGDQVGWKGLEKSYEEYLHGRRGYRYLEVDARGQELGPYGGKVPIQPVPGHSLELSLDAEIQKAAEWAFGDSTGALIVMDYRTGGVLAYLSNPSYDAELLARKISPEEWSALISNPKKPLFDRVIQGLYPPGSTFKIIAAVEAVREDSTAWEKTYRCQGSYRLGRRSFACWKATGHGKLNLIGAIEQSCNVYFYNLIQSIGLPAWANMARQFNFGELTGIDLPGEKAGLVPDNAFMDQKYGKGRWTIGNLLNLVVGQGDLLVTPLQLACLASTVANKGILLKPYVVESIRDARRRVVFTHHKDTLQVIQLPDLSWEIAREGMRRVVNGEHGTAKAARRKDFLVFGKTGTAENPHGEPHAWFIGFAQGGPYPFAWAVLVENGGSGGGTAAPVIRRFFRYLIRNNVSYE